MNRLNDNYEFRTADLALTAALCVIGYRISDTERIDPRRVTFIFDQTDELKDTVRQYWDGELKVDPQAYFNQLKLLKARIYER